MKLSGEKTLDSEHGLRAVVQHTITRTRDSLIVISLKARCGQSIHTKKITIGALDGPRTKPLSTETLQKILDDHRQKVVDEAAWKESVRQACQDLV
jgi:hypothetical protein